MKRMKWMPVIGAMVLMALVTVFSYVGCGGSSSSSGSSGDTTAPTVLSKGPAADATSIAINAVITATFSEDMDPDTITDTNFSLYDIGNDNDGLTGTVTYDIGSRTVTFTPYLPLSLANIYQARISKNVKDLAGNGINVFLYYSWSFYTRDGAWGTDLRIDTNDGANDAACPHVAMGPDGNGIAVWAELTNTQYSILSSRYVSGTGWTAPELLETDDAGMALNPKVAIDSFGNAICVWEQISGSYLTTFASRYTAGGSWGAAEAIQPEGSGDSDVPQISMALSGNAIVVWQQSNGTTNSIWANAYISGTGWSGAELLETDDGEALNPQIAVDPSGNAICVWQQYITVVASSIVSNRYISGTGWAGAAFIGTGGGSGNAVKPQIALDPWGDGLAVWQQVSGTYSSIFANRFNSVWGTARLIETNDTGDATLPNVVMDTQGFAIAVWQHNDLTSGYRSIYTAYYNCEGGTWGAAELLENTNYNTNSLCPPLIAFDQDQNAIAIWVQSDGVQDSIYFNRYLHCTNAWGTAGLAEATDGDVRNQYALAFDTLGNAMVVWRHWGVSVDIVRANRFVFE